MSNILKGIKKGICLKEGYTQTEESMDIGDWFAKKAQEKFPNATVRKDGVTLQEPPKREMPASPPVDVEQLKNKYETLKQRYDQLGGDGWQYADTMMPRDREAQNIYNQMNQILQQLSRAGVAEGLNEFDQGDFNGGDDSNDLQLYLNVAKKLNMKKYKPSTAHNLIAKKMAELVDVVDDDKVDYARHMARKAQGLPNMLEQGVAEGMENNPVVNAITRRIMMQRPDLLQHGPEAVMAAIDEVADIVGDVDEIGSSDVSGWVRHVEQSLSKEDNLSELDNKTLKNYHKGAMHDTLTGKKDRNPGMVKAMMRMAGLNKPIVKDKVLDELTGWQQQQPAKTTVPVKQVQQFIPKDTRSQLQRAKDAGNKNWFKKESAIMKGLQK